MITDLSGKSTDEWVKFLGIETLDGKGIAKKFENSEIKREIDVIRAKYNDICTMWKELDSIYNCYNIPDKLFMSEHGCNLSFLRKVYNYDLKFLVCDEKELDEIIDEELDIMKDAFEHIMDEKPSKYARVVTLKSLPDFNVEEEVFDFGIKERWRNAALAMSIINDVYDFVMEKGAEEDKIVAQKMVDTLTSLFSKETLLEYTPYQERDIDTSNRKGFDPNQKVYLKVAESFVKEINGKNGKFYTVKLPDNLIVGSETVGRYSFIYSDNRESDKILEREIKKEGNYFSFKFKYNELLKVSKPVGKKPDGTWIKDYKDISVESLATALEEVSKPLLNNSWMKRE